VYNRLKKFSMIFGKPNGLLVFEKSKYKFRSPQKEAK